jgi:hypothetical protein
MNTLPLVKFSTFSSTLAPALGDHTFIRMVRCVAKSMGAGSVSKLPPQGWPGPLIIRPTLLLVLMPPECGLLITVAFPPSKSTKL